MPYNGNIPLAADLLSDSQGEMRGNFADIATLVAVNHGAFGAADQGMHKWVTFPVGQPANPLLADEIGLRGITSQFTNRPEFMFNRFALAPNFPFTVRILGDFVPIWATLGGNALIFKTGQAQGIGPHRIDFPRNPDTPVFTNIYLVILSLNILPREDVFLAIQNFDILGFNAVATQRTDTFPRNAFYRYIAIGDNL